MLQGKGQKEKWPTSGGIGYISPAVWRVPDALEQGTESAMAHPQVGRLATPPMPSGGPQRFRAGDKIGKGPQVGGLATLPLPLGGPPTLQSGGQNHKGPTSGPGDYITLAVLGVPNAS